MKIGIITFHCAHNYGAVLQAWSLQEYLKKQGHTVEMVNLRLPVIANLYKLYKVKNKKFISSTKVNKVLNKGYNVARFAYTGIKNPNKKKKYNAFENFIKNKFTLTKECRSLKELKDAKLKYDLMIVGSDQVWNAEMMKGINPAYFLQFANVDAIRVSYAASVGTDEIPDKYKLLFKRYLREIDVISVRESKAVEQISKLTDKPVHLVSDPTFLLKREDFDTLKKKTNISGKYIYVHNVHLKRVDEQLNSMAEAISKRLGLPIVHNMEGKVFKNHGGNFYGGPEEFIGMVEGAEYIITNSFHCTIFSIIYRKQFITIPHFKNPDRMKFLLSELGLESRLLADAKLLPKDLSSLASDYKQVEVKKEKMGEQARAFLQEALKAKKEVDKRTYFDNADKFRCCGCFACKDICPTNAITMEEDKEGFLYPVINEELCINCHKCKKVCVYKKDGIKNLDEQDFPKVYAAYNKDDKVHTASTSGGMFTPMYRNILEKGGKIVGVKYGENLKVMCDIAETESECEKFRGSKYIQADTGSIKVQVKKLLEEGNYVLYSGTPCQIAGLKSYLNKTYEKLYLVELICQSAGSPKVFRKYREFLEEQYNSKMTKFTFRNSFKSINTPAVVAEFESGDVDVEYASENNLLRAFYDGTIQRPACYVCEFGLYKCGVADITIGDYWGIDKQHPEFVNDKGVSILKINTPKGEQLFNEIKKDLILLESTYNKAYAANHREAKSLYTDRANLMNYIDDYPIDDLLLTFNRRKKGGIKKTL